MMHIISVSFLPLAAFKEELQILSLRSIHLGEGVKVINLSLIAVRNGITVMQ